MEEYDLIPVGDGHIVGRPQAQAGTLEELQSKCEQVARIICRDFADQEVPLDTRPCDYAIELEGQWHKFNVFPGFRPDLRTPDYDTREHRAKRRRCIRMQNLCRAYTNAIVAIGCYEKLRGECINRAATVEMLAKSCVTFGQQYSQFVQWDIQTQRRKNSSREGGKRGRRFADPQNAKLLTNAISLCGTNISAIVRLLNKTKPNEERSFGRDAVKNELKSRGLIKGK